MSLRFAYNTNGAANHRLDDAIRLIADAGYDGVALTLDHHHLDPFADGWWREADRVGGLLDGLGLGSVIETGARYLLDPVDKHEPTLVSATGRERRVAFLSRAIDVAGILGSETVSFWAGVPKPGVAPTDAWRWLDAGLAQVLDHAEAKGVTASFEPEPGMLVETVSGYARLTERHPRLRLALDTGHCLVTEDIDPAAAVRAYADRLGTVAVEDMRRGDHTHLPFGQGDMDMPAVLDALDAIGWTRLVCVELSRESPRAHQAIPEAIAYLRGVPGLVRICFVSRRFFPAISGMSIYALNLLRQLVAGGHDVTMVSQFYGDPALRGVYGGGPPPPVPGVRVIGLEALGEQDGGDFERDIDGLVFAIVREHGRAPFDLIHAQYGYPTGWAAMIAAARLRLPCVVSIQGGDGHWVGSCCETHRLAMTRVLDSAGALLIGGRSFAAEVSERLGTAPERFTIVPGAVDTTRFTAGERVPGPLRLLYHGRVDRRKGVLDFLQALPGVTGDWTATVSGIGPDLAAAEALADELGLRDRVRFGGYADYDAAPALYRAHDVFVSPTYAEGFSNTILEAMAAGHAVLSCRSVGVVDCLRDGENGLLVAPGDVPALAAGLTRLVGDAGLRARLGAAALTECRAVYGWEAVGRRIMAVYERMRGRPQAAFDEALPVTPCRFRATPQLL